MRRVLIISYDFPPSMDVGSHSCVQIARHLSLYGWEPIVLTVQERYLENIDVGCTGPFPGHIERTRILPHPLSIYRGLKSRLRSGADGTTREGGSVKKMGTLRRWVLSLMMTPDIYTGWILPASLAGLRLIRQQRADHLFSSGPCWTNHLVGLILSQWTGLPWAAQFRDPWTQGPPMKAASAPSVYLEAKLERMVVRRAKFVVCVTDQHTDMLRRIYHDLPSDKFVTIPNGFDGAEWEEAGLAGSMEERRRDDKFVITYTGSLYHGRTPLPLFRALRDLADSGEIDLDRVEVDLIGWCDVAEGYRVAELAQQYCIGRCVTITGPLGRRETLRRATKSGLLLLLAEEWPLRIPAKTYEYLRSGKPILALTSEETLVELFKKTGGAWVVDPRDGKGIAAAVREAYRGWMDGRDGPVPDSTVVANFDRRLLAGRFAEVFEIAISGTLHRDGNALP